MKFEDLTPEQKKKARVCKTPEEFPAIAQEAGYELTNAELEVMNHAKQSGCTKEEFIKDNDMDFSQHKNYISIIDDERQTKPKTETKKEMRPGQARLTVRVFWCYWQFNSFVV